jgi:hypothetical protein
MVMESFEPPKYIASLIAADKPRDKAKVEVGGYSTAPPAGRTKGRDCVAPLGMATR